jgi:hypothetical protein
MFHFVGIQFSWGAPFSSHHGREKLLLAFALVGLAFWATGSAQNPAQAVGDEPFRLDWSSPELDQTYSVAWGDYDNDGDLDLAVGNGFQCAYMDLNCNCRFPNRIYRNDNGHLISAQVFGCRQNNAPQLTYSLAWGDYDNDGDLDLAIGDYGNHLRIYRNLGSNLGTDPIWISEVAEQTTSLAWGDVDNDGDLDLAVGNEGEPNTLYFNMGGTLSIQPTILWQVTAQNTQSIAWGDVNNDGALDLAVGNSGASQLYLNTGNMLSTVPITLSILGDVQSLTWGDMNGDSYLDLAVGYDGYPAEVYLYYSDIGMLSPTYSWRAANPSGNNTHLVSQSVAWGDYDNDGDQDLMVSNVGYPTRLYRNINGRLETDSSWNSLIAKTMSIAWGDYDNDGDLDLAAGNFGGSSQLFRNENGKLALTVNWKNPIIGPGIFTLGRSNLAWGDYDNDGDLDLAVGFERTCLTLGGCTPIEPNRLYENQGGILTASQDWQPSSNIDTHSMAWGDYDNDGDLDLAVGNGTHWANNIWGPAEVGSPNYLYQNNAGILGTTPIWLSSESAPTTSLAWGDYDQDGDLDLAVGNGSEYWSWIGVIPFPNQLYKNEGMENGSCRLALAWSSTEADMTNSVAWGDYDNDGDLDLAVGNLGQNRLYRNDRGNLTPSAVWSSDETDDTRSIAWGDYDGDGDLDLAAGNSGANHLYRNENGKLTTFAVWSSLEADNTTSIAWSDYDGDGDLDLAAGNEGQPNRLYRNDDGVLTTYAAWSADAASDTTSIAWGDYDGDGDPDLAIGNKNQAGQLYRNTGGETSPFGSIPSVKVVRPMVNADFYSSPRIAETNPIPIQFSVFDLQGDQVKTVKAYYSLDGAFSSDSTLWRKAVSANAPFANLGTTPIYSSAGTPFEWIDITGSGTALTLGDEQVAGPFLIGFPMSFYGQTFRQFWVSSKGWLSFSSPPGSNYANVCLPNFSAPTNLVAPFWDDLNPGAGGRVYYQQWDENTLVVEFYQVPRYSGGGLYTFEAIIRKDGSIHFQYQTMNAPLNSATIGIQNISGGIAQQIACDTTSVQNNQAWRFFQSGPWYTFNWDTFQSGFFGQSDNVIIRIQAFPALSDHPNGLPGPYLYGSSTAQTFPFRARGRQVQVRLSGKEKDKAIVLWQPADQPDLPFTPYEDQDHTPYRTNSQGWLQGYGKLETGDKLVALVPITTTENYIIYYTNAIPNPDGVTAYTVTANANPVLNVSSANPLLLFDLSISLEWDARQDTKYLNQLNYDIQKASALLYDWSNGQVALGKVTIYHDRLHWDDADVRIYANNRRRPMAAIGGIVAATQADPNVPALLYEPGMIHMGAIWNRYGNPSGNIGDDWALALAHEFAHYALYLEDNYLGLDAQQHLISVTSCTGSAMSDPYRDDYGEFKLTAEWSPGCDNTLSEKTTGRSDWETIHAFYPALNWTTSNVGPAYLPLAVTQISEEAPVVDPQALADPRFYVTLNSASYQPGNDARAFLFRNLPTRLVDLGRPVVDSVLAYGAQPGDKVCVIEIAAGANTLTGCKTVSPNDNQQLPLAALANWQPEILVTPITTRTVDIAVGSLPAGLSLSARLYPNDSAASGVLALAWSAATQQYTGRFNLADYTTEGHVRIWAGDEATTAYEAVTDFALGGNPINRHLGGINHHRGGRINRHLGGAPGISLDGQVVLYADALDFPTGEFYTLQAATRLPDPPAWATLVGHGYWLRKSAGAPNLGNLSFSMGYLDREVPPGGESWLTIYRWDSIAQTWQPLDTDPDEQNNSATAVIPGDGLYALMTSIALNLTGPGWETFSYPVQATPTVEQALSSIAGSYTTVYWYNRDDSADPWKVYDNTGIPDWVNDLDVLHFAEAYWIRLTQSVRLWIKPGEAVQAVTQPEGFPSPPATYYGPVLAASNFTPVANMPVTAWVNGVACGSTQTQEQGGQIVYAINVHADGLNTPGCGTSGKMVRFKVGERWMGTSVAWNNDQVWLLPLDATSFIYLPLIQR